MHTLLRTLPSLLLLSGCPASEPGDKPDEAGTEDADGDGFDASIDCDDTNPAIHPEAAETWYDGVDADCSGGDDYDADQDGVRSADHGGADCDDTDPAISPAATETWYDGVDADCRGDNDNDADADGFDAVVAGGNDCDDSSASIYPGAADDWYDGVDGDCAGDNDYDADLDGYDYGTGASADCDDSDDEVHPGAIEDWYDGVDQDCNGGSDYDADLDGFDSEDHGGTDCNDRDPEAFPGAGEQLDGSDTDCDNVGDRFSVEEDYGGSFVQGTHEGGMLGASLSVGDVNNDAVDDLLVLQSTDSESALGNGLVWLIYGTSISASPLSVDGADDKISSSLTSGPLAGVVYQGDLTGDGRPEVTILGPEATSSGSAVGKVWMFGASALDGGANLTVDDATRRFEGANEGAGFGRTAGRVEDMDGDGEAELIIGAPDGNSGTAYLFLSSSATAGVTRLAADADAAWTGTSGGTDGVGSAFATGDFNSDGRGDVAVGAPGHSTATGAVYVMRGTASPTDGRIDSLRFSRLAGINSNDRCGTALAVGDTDNDGIPDLIIGAPNQVTQAGRVHIIPGEDISAGTDTVNDRSEVNHTGTTVYGHAGSSLASGGDVDGDGDHDMIVGGPGDSAGGDESGAAWLVLSGRTGDRALASADATFLGASDVDLTGTAVGMGDLNGDGLFDLAIGVPGEDSFSDEGAVYIALSGY